MNICHIRLSNHCQCLIGFLRGEKKKKKKKTKKDDIERLAYQCECGRQRTWLEDGNRWLKHRIWLGEYSSLQSSSQTCKRLRQSVWVQQQVEKGQNTVKQKTICKTQLVGIKKYIYMNDATESLWIPLRSYPEQIGFKYWYLYKIHSPMIWVDNRYCDTSQKRERIKTQIQFRNYLFSRNSCFLYLCMKTWIALTFKYIKINKLHH